MNSMNRSNRPKWPALMSALVIASWIPAGASLAERGGGEHGGRDHGGGDEHGGGDHGGGDHGGGDHGGGGGDEHGGGGSDEHGGGGGDEHGGSSAGSEDHGGGDDRGGSDSGSDDHGGGDDRSGSDDRGGDDHGGSDSGSDDHGGDDHGGDDHGGSGGGSDDDHGGSDDHGSDGGSDDHGSGGHGSDDGAGDDHGGSSGSGGSGEGGSGSGGSSELAGAAGSARDALDIAYDRTGREYRSGEIVVFGDAHTLAAAERLGLKVREEQDLPALGGSMLRLEAPDGRSAESMLAELKSAAPEAASDLNSVYRPAGSVRGAVPAAGPGAGGSRAVVGLVDTSVDRAAPGLGKSIVDARSFAPGGAESPLHGTVVASLITRSGADVIAADVFSADRAGNPAASADAIARALDWLLSRGVTVANLSLAGPPNAALQEVIRRAQARGGVVVAAAGNGGPAAPPAYPAAYPGVVAVTAVDGSGRIYRYANQGGYIVVAARGVDLTPMPGKTLSGTSYASPAVAAMLARQRLAKGPRASALAIEQLRRQARDLGAPGRDPVYGYGVVSSGVGGL